MDGLTVDGDGSQDDPGRPLGQVLDEDERHEGADEDQVELLQLQGALPVDADHPHRPEVPDQQAHRRVVHRHVVRLKDLAANRKSASANRK